MNTTYANINPNQVYYWNLSKSNHAQLRSYQRGISEDLLNLALDYGEPVFKQGLIFYVVTEKNLPEKLDHQTAEKLNNIVVVVSTRSNEIVTCYKSDNGIRHIKKKSKRLMQ